MHGVSGTPTVDDSLTAQNPHFFNSGSTIFFISDSIQEDIKQIDILVSINSDHSPVYLKFSEGINETSHGPSYWKINNSLLDNQDFVTGLT